MNYVLVRISFFVVFYPYYDIPVTTWYVFSSLEEIRQFTLADLLEKLHF